MDYLALKAEITNDPVALGYSGKTDAQIADLLNNKVRSKNRLTVTADQLIQAIVWTEWDSLTASQKQQLQLIVGAGVVSVNNTNVRTALLAMFGAGSTTRANLLALAVMPTSRADELGFGIVEYWDVARAKVA